MKTDPVIFIKDVNDIPKDIKEFPKDKDWNCVKVKNHKTIEDNGRTWFVMGKQTREFSGPIHFIRKCIGEIGRALHILEPDTVKRLLSPTESRKIAFATEQGSLPFYGDVNDYDFNLLKNPSRIPGLEQLLAECDNISEKITLLHVVESNPTPEFLDIINDIPKNERNAKLKALEQVVIYIPEDVFPKDVSREYKAILVHKILDEGTAEKLTAQDLTDMTIKMRDNIPKASALSDKIAAEIPSFQKNDYDKLAVLYYLIDNINKVTEEEMLDILPLLRFCKGEENIKQVVEAAKQIPKEDQGAGGRIDVIRLVLDTYLPEGLRKRYDIPSLVAYLLETPNVDLNNVGTTFSAIQYNKGKENIIKNFAKLNGSANPGSIGEVYDVTKAMGKINKYLIPEGPSTLELLETIINTKYAKRDSIASITASIMEKTDEAKPISKAIELWNAVSEIQSINSSSIYFSMEEWIKRDDPIEPKLQEILELGEKLKGVDDQAEKVKMVNEFESKLPTNDFASLGGDFNYLLNPPPATGAQS